MTVDIVVSLKMLALLGAIVQPIKLSSGQFAEVLNTSVQTAAASASRVKYCVTMLKG